MHTLTCWSKRLVNKTTPTVGYYEDLRLILRKLIIIKRVSTQMSMSHYT